MAKSTRRQCSKNRLGGTRYRSGLLFARSHTIATALLLCAFLAAAPLHAQETVYDNLNVYDGWLEKDAAWFTPFLPDHKMAQQFLIGDNTILDAVSIDLIRTGNGVTGSWGLELWRDDGSNRPMPNGDPDAKIADLGEIADVTQMPMTATNYRFDNLAIELEANERYWVVIDNSGLDIPHGFDSIGFISVLWPMPFPTPDPAPEEYAAATGRLGTNGAANVHLGSATGPGWLDAAEWAGEVDTFLAMMSIDVLPALPSGVQNNPGLDNSGLGGDLPPGLRGGLPRASLHAIPEPSSIVLCLFASIALVVARHRS